MGESSGHSGPCKSDKNEGKPGPITHEHDTVLSLVGMQAAVIKAEYQVVRDSVTKDKLAADLKLHDTRAGIPSKDREHAAVLSKLGHYTET